jgi:CYTH domain-containing protein
MSARIVEGHFPSRPDRRQLVRVEQGRSLLILFTQGENGQFTEEQVDVPGSHAEALMNVAAGVVAFDRTPLPLGGDIDALLDRFLLPEGLDILTVTIPTNPHAFAPLPWFGLEVTDEPAFGARDLALGGAPRIEPMEPSDVALNTLLDALEGHTPLRLRNSGTPARG